MESNVEYTPIIRVRNFYTQSDLNMQQRRSMELMTDYNLEFVYHEGWANLVVDSLSRKSSHTLATLNRADELNWDFARLNLEVIREGKLQHCLTILAIQLSLFKEILSSQDEHPKLVKSKKQACEGKVERFFVHEDEGLRFSRWCWPSRTAFLNEAHDFKFSFHLRGDKIYHNLKLMF